MVSQREVGFDTESFEVALKNTLRQAPDVILIGEVRDRETMEAAITFAETGHLCLATLHSNNANQAIERIMNFFPGERHTEIYLQLSLNLRAIVSQRLIAGVDGRRVAALEILHRHSVRQGSDQEGRDRHRQGGDGAEHPGRRTDLRPALLELFVEGRITDEQALANADSANNLRIQISNYHMKQKGDETRAADKQSGLSTGGLRIRGEGRTRRI